MKKLNANFLVYEGEHFKVEFYFNESGEVFIWKDFIGLSDNDKAAFLARIEKLANSTPGTIHPKTIFNLEDSMAKIWAIKFGNNRFCMFFFKGVKIIITNAYKRHSQQNRKKEHIQIEKASKMKADYESPIRTKTYYPLEEN